MGLSDSDRSTIKRAIKKLHEQPLRIEANHFIKKVSFLSCIPYLGRPKTIALIDNLYKLGAISVEIGKTESDRRAHSSNTDYITEIFARYNGNTKVRNDLFLEFLDKRAAGVAVDPNGENVVRARWDMYVNWSER